MPDNNTTWNHWLDHHGPAALLYARQITPSLADAEDAVQSGFIRFWHRRQKADDPIAYLFACIRSAALDTHRSEKRRKRRELTIAKETPMLFPPATDITDHQLAIEHALTQLPEPQREILILKIWANLTFKQIAISLNESPHTIASRYRYAIEKLATLLTTEGAK